MEIIFGRIPERNRYIISMGDNVLTFPSSNIISPRANNNYHEGYCIKSPRTEGHSWKRRWFTLSALPVTDMQQFHKQHYKHHRKNANYDEFKTKGHSTRLVLTYYTNQRDEQKRKVKCAFIVDDAAVFDHPSGTRKHTYVIKIQMGKIYKERLLFLCVPDKKSHEMWLKCFSLHSRDNRGEEEWMEGLKCTQVQRYASVERSLLHDDLDKLRIRVKEEREEKIRMKENFVIF